MNNIKALKKPERVIARRAMREESRHYSPVLMTALPVKPMERGPFAAWRNRNFLVQAYQDGGTVRLSVDRADFDISTGDGDDGITWDDLMQVKNACGYQDCWAVEVYPPEEHLVNVANMRHLWILDIAPSFAWRKKGGDQ